MAMKGRKPQRELRLPPSFAAGCQREPLTAALIARNFLLLGRFLRWLLGRFFLGRLSLFLGSWFSSCFLRRLLGRFFLGGSFLDWRFLGRRLLLWRPALAPARWNYRRRFPHRWRNGNLVVFFYQNRFFFLFFLFFQILFQRFAVGAAVTVDRKSTR